MMINENENHDAIVQTRKTLHDIAKIKQRQIYASHVTYVRGIAQSLRTRSEKDQDSLCDQKIMKIDSNLILSKNYPCLYKKGCLMLQNYPKYHHKRIPSLFHIRFIAAFTIQHQIQSFRLRLVVQELRKTRLFENLASIESKISFEQMQEFIQDKKLNASLSDLFRLILPHRCFEQMGRMNMQIRAILCGLLLITHTCQISSDMNLDSLKRFFNISNELWDSLIIVIQNDLVIISNTVWKHFHDKISNKWDSFHECFSKWKTEDRDALLKKLLEEYLALEDLEKLIFKNVSNPSNDVPNEIEIEWREPLEMRKKHVRSMITSIKGTLQDISSARTRALQSKMIESKKTISLDNHSVPKQLIDTMNHKDIQNYAPIITQLVHELYLNENLSLESIEEFFPRRLSSYIDNISSIEFEKLPILITFHWHTFILKTTRQQLICLIESSFFTKKDTVSILLGNLQIELDIENLLDNSKICLYTNTDACSKQDLERKIRIIVEKIIQWMKKLCAPVRDESINNLENCITNLASEELDYINIYKLIFDILYDMKLDLLKFGLDLVKHKVRQLDYVIKLEWVSFTQLFTDHILSNRIDKQILIKSIDQSIFEGKDANELQTMYMDHSRLHKWNVKIESMALYLTIATILKQHILDPKHLKNVIITRNNVSITSLENFKETINNSCPEMIDIISLNAIERLFSASRHDHPVFKVFHQRVREYLVQFLDIENIEYLFSVIGTIHRCDIAIPSVSMAKDNRLENMIKPPHAALCNSFSILPELQDLSQQLVRWLHLHLSIYRKCYE